MLSGTKIVIDVMELLNSIAILFAASLFLDNLWSFEYFYSFMRIIIDFSYSL